MKQEYIAQGKTIDEAIDEAAAQLGIDRDELSIEILETPSKGFLGFGCSPAVQNHTIFRRRFLSRQNQGFVRDGRTARRTAGPRIPRTVV